MPAARPSQLFPLTVQLTKVSSVLLFLMPPPAVPPSAKLPLMVQPLKHVGPGGQIQASASAGVVSVRRVAGYNGICQRDRSELPMPP